MKFLNKLLSLLLIVLVVSCSQNEKSGETEEANDTAETAATEAPAGTVLNANLASEEEMGQAGIPAELAAQVLANRPFLTMNDLDALIGDSMDAAAKEVLYKKVFVPFNLNTTAEADFKMIPGVGDRMAHEFEEYRPYLKLEQFRKEIFNERLIYGTF